MISRWEHFKIKSCKVRNLTELQLDQYGILVGYDVVMDIGIGMKGMLQQN